MRKSPYKRENQARWPARRPLDPREFPYLPVDQGIRAGETGSLWTVRPANQSASPKNPRAERGRLFRAIAEIYSPVNDDQIAASNREIPIVVLDPVD